MHESLAPDVAAAFGLATEVVDGDAYRRTVERFRERRIYLPCFYELADPAEFGPRVLDELGVVSKDEPHPRNLFRVHWHNALDGSGPLALPDHVELPPELTGVDARIVVALGNRFPMIGAHKVLAAYACLAPRLVTGQFDPTRHRAIWPSTGNYARGGVAISRIMGCRGVAVLPAGMSKARFDWLDQWVEHPDDIIRTPGTESNVKEIYDKCAELALDPQNVIFNQFSEFANHLAHYSVTGASLERILQHLVDQTSGLRLAAFVSASGSAGTLGAGDWLKEEWGSRTVAVEALECPTMLENGYGEHNIQGIGDKHIPLIHNVMGTDVVAGISDRSTDALDVLFNTDAGRAYLVDTVGVAGDVVASLRHFGLSSICNVLAAIKIAKLYDLGHDDVILTVATDGSEMYDAERAALLADRYPEGFGAVDAARIYGEHLASVDTSAVLEMGEQERRRVFNLGYYTWVEQQGIDVAHFDLRRRRSFWQSIRPVVEKWDDLIVRFNSETGLEDEYA
jgi:cysteine synthase A